MKNKNKNNKQYCVYCGEENNIKDKKCSKCHRKLNPKSHDFLDYLKKHIKSDLKSNVEDKAISIITNYLKSHLYGLILTFSVIASVTVVVHVNAIDNSVQKVESKPTDIEETIKYAGEGLSSDEVVNLYVDALKNKDIDLVESLQYDTFFDIDYEPIIDISYDSILKNDGKTTTSHDLANNINIYFDNVDYIGIFELQYGYHIYYNDYIVRRYVITLNYCSYVDRCDDYSEVYYANEEIQIIEVDNNYYVLGEKPLRYASNKIYLERLCFVTINGDTSNVEFGLLSNEYNTCNGDEECYINACKKYVQ